MFNSEIYTERRKKLKEKLKSGIILFLGNEESPMNYLANPYYFRQDSTFLYFFGLSLPGLAATIDLDSGEECLYGYDFTLDDIVWMGPQPTLKDLSRQVGLENSGSLQDFEVRIKKEKNSGRKIHFIPQYRGENIVSLQDLLDIQAEEVNGSVSEELIKAVVTLRSIKSAEEIKEIEYALDISYEMHTIAMKRTKPGMYEREIAGKMKGLTHSLGKGTSFPIIFSINGQTLHNHSHDNLMKEGDIVVNDSGAESLLHYASDITRTYPVDGKFTPEQKEIYSVVLESQLEAIKAIKPGIKYRDIHILAAKVIAEGLKDLGFMKGEINEAVEQGAHALFFPHGLGHMMGLDVHDMENLGENFVGYDESTRRSTQFGLAYLRLAKTLQPGFVLTVEPGIYFIPELIDMWKSQKKFSDFINYDRVENFRDFGGIRIEDDVLVTKQDHRILGKPIPKTIQEVEDVCLGKA